MTIGRIKNRIYALSLLDRGYSHDINCIKLNVHSTLEHEKKKFETCWRILKEGNAFITEGIFKTGGRCDILEIRDNGVRIIEIVKSEKESSLVEKARKYPAGVPIEIERVD